MFLHDIYHQEKSVQSSLLISVLLDPITRKLTGKTEQIFLDDICHEETFVSNSIRKDA